MPLNVLIVDDSAVMRAMVARVLRLTGLPLGEVGEAGDGAAGLAAARARPADLVLLDVNMPVMDGEEMLRRLRADPATAHVPVVVVSTEGSEARRHALEALGALFIRKPFKPEGLRDVIVRAAGVTPDSTPHAAHAAAAPGDDGAFDF
jgi:two-component system chemotaxis response regulator CheY